MAISLSREKGWGVVHYFFYWVQTASLEVCLEVLLIKINVVAFQIWMKALKVWSVQNAAQFPHIERNDAAVYFLGEFVKGTVCSCYVEVFVHKVVAYFVQKAAVCFVSLQGETHSGITEWASPWDDTKHTAAFCTKYATTFVRKAYDGQVTIKHTAAWSQSIRRLSF